jgi:hypothetical protein
MQAIQNKRWLVILFFLIFGMMLAAFIYAAIVGPRSYQRQTMQKRYAPTGSGQVKTPAADQKSFVLILNRVQSVGKMQLIYRGIDQTRLKIDVIIPEFDPKTAYSHAIPIEQAKQGIRLGGARFKLTDIRKSKVRLDRVK